MTRLKKLLAILCAIALLGGMPIQHRFAMGEEQAEVVETSGSSQTQEAKPAETPPPTTAAPTQAPASEEQSGETASQQTQPPAQTQDPGQTGTTESSGEQSGGEATRAPAESGDAGEPVPETTQPTGEEPGATPDPGSTEAPGETPAPTDPAGDPSVDPVAEPTQTPAEEEPEQPEEIPALNVSVSASDKHAKVNEETLRFGVNVSGGLEPYSVSCELIFEGSRVYSTSDISGTISYLPKQPGVYTFNVTVTDAADQRASAGCITAAYKKDRQEVYQYKPVYGLRRGDNYAQRLIHVAQSQLGYKESKTDIRLDDDGNVQGYTVYGHWYGLPYVDWCCMFVAWCLDRAGIPEYAVARSSSCYRMSEALGWRYIDDEKTYLPEPGDLIYFHHDRENTGKNHPNHIGIVTGLEGDVITTIEGNSGLAVRESTYLLDDKCIVGYLSMRDVMADYDYNYEDENGGEPVLNRVRVEIGEGAHVTVDGEPLEEDEATAVNGTLVFALTIEDGYVLDKLHVDGAIHAWTTTEDGVKTYTIKRVRDDEAVIEISTKLDKKRLEAVTLTLNVMDQDGEIIGDYQDKPVGRGSFVLDDPKMPPLKFEGYTYSHAELNGSVIGAIEYEPCEELRKNGLWYVTIDGVRTMVADSGTLTLCYDALPGTKPEAAEAEDDTPEEADAAEEPDAADDEKAAEATEDAAVDKVKDEAADAPAEDADSTEKAEALAPLDREVKVILLVVDENGRGIGKYSGRGAGKGQFVLNEPQTPPIDIEGYRYVHAKMGGRVIDTLKYQKGEWWMSIDGNAERLERDGVVTLFYETLPLQ